MPPPEVRTGGPARPGKGSPLLQGLAVCGVCGKRMSVRYHHRCDGSPVPDYVCQREGIATATPPCQTICGSGVDAAVAGVVATAVSPLAIEASLAVADELTQRAAEADRIRAVHVDRATSMRERKRLIRHVISDVTLIKAGEHITAHVRFARGPRRRRAGRGRRARHG